MGKGYSRLPPTEGGGPKWRRLAHAVGCAFLRMKHHDPYSLGVRFPLSAVLTFPDPSQTKKIPRLRSG